MVTTPIHAGADVAASAELREVDGRQVVWFRIAGGKHHGAIGVRGGETVERAVRLAGELRIPLIGEMDTSGHDGGSTAPDFVCGGRYAFGLVRTHLGWRLREVVVQEKWRRTPQPRQEPAAT